MVDKFGCWQLAVMDELMCFSFPYYFPYYYLFIFLILHTNKNQKEEKQGTNEWCNTESGEEAIIETIRLRK